MYVASLVLLTVAVFIAAVLSVILAWMVCPEMDTFERKTWVWVWAVCVIATAVPLFFAQYFLRGYGVFNFLFTVIAVCLYYFGSWILFPGRVEEPRQEVSHESAKYWQALGSHVRQPPPPSTNPTT